MSNVDVNSKMNTKSVLHQIFTGVHVTRMLSTFDLYLVYHPILMLLCSLTEKYTEESTILYAPDVRYSKGTTMRGK